MYNHWEEKSCHSLIEKEKYKIKERTFDTQYQGEKIIKIIIMILSQNAVYHNLIYCKFIHLRFLV